MNSYPIKRNSLMKVKRYIKMLCRNTKFDLLKNHLIIIVGSRKDRHSLTDNQREWGRTKDQLVSVVKQLGFPEELGEQIAKQLGSPKAMNRMLSYLYNVKPRSVELVVDEMLAICSEIDAWRDKKESEEANARYNEMLYYGLGTEEE